MKEDTFHGRIKKLRKQRGYTAQYVADKIGVARNSLSQYESGIRLPNLEIVASLAAVLNTSTDYLLLLTNDPAPKDPDWNINNYLKESGLHFDGVPLSPEELQPLREFIGLLVDKKKVINKKVV